MPSFKDQPELAFIKNKKSFFKQILNYFLIVLVLLLAAWILTFFIFGKTLGSDIDHFYIQTPLIKIRDDLSASYGSLGIFVFLSLPVLFLFEWYRSQNILKSLLLCIMVLPTFFLLGFIYSVTIDRMGVQNEDIVKIKDPSFELVDDNSKVIITFTIEANSELNNYPDGLIPFGGVETCFYSGLREISCNYLKINQYGVDTYDESMNIGKNSSQGYSFFINDASDELIQYLTNHKQVRAKMTSAGRESPFLVYKIFINKIAN